MNRILALLLAAGLVAGCGGNPLDDDEVVEEPPAEEEPNELPPGTEQPSPTSAIERREAVDGQGGGFAEDLTYDPDTDTFDVDNLAFDGDNTYARGVAVDEIGVPTAMALGVNPYEVYDADLTTTDIETGNIIDTYTYRAIYGRSPSGISEFAIVRSGDYTGYGFGGFIYRRNDVDGADFVPRTQAEIDQNAGDAQFVGPYGGVRVFNGRGGLEYVEGEAELTIDLKDFNDERYGVAMVVYDRQLYDINGNNITSAYLDAYEALREDEGVALNRPTDGSGNDKLPNLGPVIDPDVSDGNGELKQGLFSRIGWADGQIDDESGGEYYAIISGEGADQEIVGIAVTTGDDPRNDGVTFQETGGFIVYRQ